MKLSEIIKLGVREVSIRSYGYEEVSIFGNVWQPFRNCRQITFVVDEDGFLYNPTFWFDEAPLLDDEFKLVKGKYVSVQDYDLCSKPDYD